MKASWQAVSVEEGRAAVKRGELVWFRPERREELCWIVQVQKEKR